jgi:hypothetical protein
MERARQTRERPHVAMIHVCVRNENGVERGQLADAQRGLHEPSRPQGSDARHTHADARTERGVGQQPRPVKVDEHTRMSEPRHRQTVIRPIFGTRAMWGGQNCLLRLPEPLLQKTPPEAARKSRVRS